jgi:uncharacterized protein YjbI with pentapeptide repeats
MTIETEPSPSTEREEQTRSVPMWLVVLAVLALGGVVELIVYGYLERPGWVGVSDKKFWDYLELLIVPAALALGVYWLNRMQERERQAQEAQREREREAEEAQRERERQATEEARNERERKAQSAQRERELEVQNQWAQDAALQAYLDQMSTLLLDKNLRSPQEDSEVRTLARARTLTILSRLDGDHERSVLQFLYESDLLSKGRVVVDLKGADLSEASLSAINLHGADLSETNLRGADLNAAGLSDADLSDADLSDANLMAADLSEAHLRGADFLKADLRGADMKEAKLSDADLSGAHLSAVNLRGADLRGADLSDRSLSDANLTRADLLQVRGVTNDELVQLVGSLAGVTMPNGQKYEAWLKDRKGGGEAGQNDGA